MVNSVGKVDLTQSDNLSGIRKLISDMFGKDYKTVSVFSAKDHDDVRMQSERLADNRLITVANEAIALNDEYYGCFMPSVFGPSHDGLYGGYLRQRAVNSKMHAATNKPIEEGNLPPAGSCPLREYRDWGFRRMGSKTPIEGLTPND